MKNMKAMALEEMMGSEKPLAMGKAPMPAKQEGGMESILVTPEEKAMLMQMRQESGAEDYAEDDSAQAPGLPMGV